MTEGIRLKPHKEEARTQTSVMVFWTVMAVLAVGIVYVCVNATYADIFNTINTELEKIYGYILLISTMVAVVAAAICFIIKMVSKSQRACEESSAWLKRIAIAWVALNALGLIATWFTNLAQTGNWSSMTTAISNGQTASNGVSH